VTRSALIVDDAGAFAALAVQALFDAGFDARAATTVDAAFAELVRGVPDVVVLDHALDRDGAMLRATLVHHRARVLYVSGFDAEGDAPGVAASHAWPFLPKPFDTAALLAAVASLFPPETPSMPERNSPDPRPSIVPDATEAPGAIATRP
jgi:DNA-binding response OmpR family regulator